MTEEQIKELIDKSIKAAAKDMEVKTEEFKKFQEDITKQVTKLQDDSKTFEDFKSQTTEKYDKAIEHILTKPVKQEPTKPERTFDPITGTWSGEGE